MSVVAGVQAWNVSNFRGRETKGVLIDLVLGKCFRHVVPVPLLWMA